MHLCEKMGIESVSDVLRRSRLRWLGHVLRKNDEDWVRKCLSLEADGKRSRGRSRKRWTACFCQRKQLIVNSKYS